MRKLHSWEFDNEAAAAAAEAVDIAAAAADTVVLGAFETAGGRSLVDVDDDVAGSAHPIVVAAIAIGPKASYSVHSHLTSTHEMPPILLEWWDREVVR